MQVFFWPIQGSISVTSRKPIRSHDPIARSCDRGVWVKRASTVEGSQTELAGQSCVKSKTVARLDDERPWLVVNGTCPQSRGFGFNYQGQPVQHPYSDQMRQITRPQVLERLAYVVAIAAVVRGRGCGPVPGPGPSAPRAGTGGPLRTHEGRRLQLACIIYSSASRARGILSISPNQPAENVPISKSRII